MTNNKGGRKKATPGAPILTPEAKRLNIVFNEYGGSQNAFAKVLEVNQGTLSRMLSGEYPLSIKVVRIVCYRLGYAADWFINGIGPKKPKGDKPGKVLTDIAEFKTDLKMINARVDKLQARVNYIESIDNK